MPITALSHAPLAAALPAQSIAAGAHVTSGYVDATECERIAASVTLGSVGGGAVTISFLQAQDAAGTGAKALTAGGFAGGAAVAVDDTRRQIEGKCSALDNAGGFTHVAVDCAVVGGAGALCAASLHRVEPNYK